MAKWFGDQEVPPLWLKLWRATLGGENSPRRWSGRRYPWRLPKMQKGGSGVSATQLAERETFSDCVRCFNQQPRTDGAEPPDLGPRSREWWYLNSIGSGLIYFDYFMKCSLLEYLDGNIPDWCHMGGANTGEVRDDAPDEALYDYEWIDAVYYVDNPQPCQYRTFILRPPGARRLWFWHENGYGNYNVGNGAPFDWYECDEEWIPAMLTWNNQPPLGKRFQRVTYGIPNNGKWNSILVPEVFSVVFTSPVPGPPHYNSAAIMRGVGWAEPEYRPFWVC